MQDEERLREEEEAEARRQEEAEQQRALERIRREAEERRLAEQADKERKAREAASKPVRGVRGMRGSISRGRGRGEAAPERVTRETVSPVNHIHNSDICSSDFPTSGACKGFNFRNRAPYIGGRCQSTIVSICPVYIIQERPNSL